MLEGCKQNFVHTKTQGKEQWPQKRRSQTCLWVLQRHGSAAACGADRGSGCSSPGRCMWCKSSWRRSPLAPQNWRRVRPKKFSHCCKSSRAHNRFPNLRIQQRYWEPPGNLTLKASGIWLQNFHRKVWENRLWEGTNKALCAPGERSSNPTRDWAREVSQIKINIILLICAI